MAAEPLTVLLASFPRSGNTLFRQVLEECYGIPTYTIYKNEEKVLWADRLWPHDAPPDQPFYFVKEHGFAVHDGPTIYIVRDGRDTLISFAHHYKGYTLQDHLTNGVWSAHVRWFLERMPIVVKFEDLISDPVNVVTHAVEQAGLQVGTGTVGELTPFETLHDKAPDFYRSGKVGQWRDTLTPELHEAFWHVNGPAMEQLGYERD